MALNEVLIVGAGPVGLSLGCFLQYHGIKSKVIEKKYEKNTLSKSAGLQPNSLELFDFLSISEELIAKSNYTSKITFVKYNKKMLCLDLSKQKSRYAGMHIVGQNEVEHILMKKYLEMGGDLVMGCELIGDLQNDEYHEEVTCQYQMGDDVIHDEFSFVVGCDGVNSTVRKLLGIDFKEISKAQRYLIIEGKLAIDIDKDSTYCFINDNGQAFSVVPMKDSIYRIVAPFPEEGKDIPGFLRDNAKFIPFRNIENILSPDCRVSEFMVQKRMAGQYRKANVFLAGDAAHVHSPAGAQGMNSGIVDAYTLSHKIALVLRQDKPMSYLDSYHEERYHVVEAMIKNIDKAINLSLSVSHLKKFF